MTQINVIKIPCTGAIATALNYDAGNTPFCQLFDGSNNLVLPIQPGGYKRVNSGGSPEVRDGFVSSRVIVPTRRIEIEYQIDDAREEIRWACEALMANALANRGYFAAITVYDFVLLETYQDKAQGYTVRQGVMEVEAMGGSVNYVDGTPTSRRLGMGTRIKLIETTRRPYTAIS